MSVNQEKIPRGLTVTVTELHERWNAFRKKNPTDEHCIEGIILEASLDTKNCPQCGSTSTMERIFGSPVAKCRSCRHELTVFKGTFFERMRIPLLYYGALHLRSLQIGISSNRLAKLVEVAQSTAYEVQKKIDTVVEEVLMTNAVVVDSGDFREPCTKRSSETPARQRPVAEHDVVDEEQRRKRAKAGGGARPGTGGDRSGTEAEGGAGPNTSADGTPDPRKPEEDEIFSCKVQEKLFEMLLEQPMPMAEIADFSGFDVSETLAALTMLRVAGRVKMDNQGRYCAQVSGLSSFFKQDGAELEKFFQEIKHVFHGISRKNLQKYLAWYWTLVGTQFLQSNLLIKACAKFRHITRSELRQYVTAPGVKMLPA